MSAGDWSASLPPGPAFRSPRRAGDSETKALADGHTEPSLPTSGPSAALLSSQASQMRPFQGSGPAGTRTGAQRDPAGSTGKFGERQREGRLWGEILKPAQAIQKSRHILVDLNKIVANESPRSPGKPP